MSKPQVHKIGPVDGAEPWKVTVHVDTSTGVARCVGLDVRGYPMPDGEMREMTTIELRNLSVPRLLAEACRDLDLLAEAVVRDLGVPAAELEEARAALDLRGRRYDRAHFEELARVYAEAGGDAPTRTVAEHFGITRSAAKKQVVRCRELGLLPPARPGRPGAAGKVSP
jgi:hypothetical protein